MNLEDIEDAQDLLAYDDLVLTIESTRDLRSGEVPDSIKLQKAYIKGSFPMRHEPDRGYLFVSSAWVKEQNIEEMITKLKKTTRYVTTKPKNIFKGTGLTSTPENPAVRSCLIFDLHRANAITHVPARKKPRGWRAKELHNEAIEFALKKMRETGHLQLTYNKRATPELQEYFDYANDCMQEAYELYADCYQMMLNNRLPRKPRHLPNTVPGNRSKFADQYKAESIRCQGVDALLSKELRLFYETDVDKYVMRDGAPHKVVDYYRPTEPPVAWLGKAVIRDKYTQVYIKLACLTHEYADALKESTGVEITDLRYMQDERYKGKVNTTIGGHKCRCAKFEFSRSN
jgi:hypothetical protein